MRAAWKWGQAIVSWNCSRPHNIWRQWHCHSLYRSTACHPDMASTSLVLSTSTWGRWSLGRPPVDLGLLHADMEPFTFHSSLPWHELECALLMGVCDDHQVISIKKLLWHTGAELTRQRFQQQDGEQWDKARALTQIPTPNSSLYWPLTRTRLWALWYMPWITSIQFIHIQAP